MTGRTHPDSGRATGGIVEMLQDRIAEIEDQLDAVGAGGVSLYGGDSYGDGNVYRGERSADSAVTTYTVHELACTAESIRELRIQREGDPS